MNAKTWQFEYKSNRDLQDQLVEEIRDFKKSDPFASVTLVVDNPLQGMMLRRQLVEKLAEKGMHAVSNIRVHTLDELVHDLCEKIGNQFSLQPSGPVIEASIFALMNKFDSGASRKPSMSTAMAVAQAYKKLQFVGSPSVREVLASKKLNSTQEMVLELVLAAREIFSSSQMHKLVEDVINATESKDRAFFQSIGKVLILSKALPVVVNELFGHLEAKSTAIRWYIPSEVSATEVFDPASCFVVSCPDPETEVSVLVRLLVQAASNQRLDRVAILYPDEAQYASQIQELLDDLDIGWHGRGRTLAQESVLFRTTEILLEALIDSTESESGFDRPKLMRLIQNGHLRVDGIQLKSEQIRKWVRRNELYADAAKWLVIVDSFEIDRESEDTKLAREHLGHLLKFILNRLENISASKNWEELGKRLLAAIADLHEGLEVLVDGSAEEKAFKEIRLLLERELPLLDELSERDETLKIPLDFRNLLRLLRQKVGNRKARVGKLSAGIHVGQVSEAELLDFDQVYMLGLTEGLLPSSEKPDSFLPASVLEALGENDLARISRDYAIRNSGTSLRIITSGAGKSILFRPRGGTIQKLEDEPSRFIPSSLKIGTPVQSANFQLISSLASSFWSTIGSFQLGPISESDKKFVREIISASPDENFRFVMRSWRNPKFNKHFGNLSDSQDFASVTVWSNEFKKPLTSSKIDSFLRCPYEFFVTEVLGFNSNERPDIILDFKPYQFGKYFHKQMELLVKDLSSTGQLPGEGQPWPAGTHQKFMRDYLLRNLGNFISTGQGGWSSILRNHIEEMSYGIELFFDREPFVLRTGPDLAVTDAELSFGESDQLLDVIVDEGSAITATDGEKTYRIVGQIDRVDASLDGTAVGIMDFKTGSFKKQKSKLGFGDKGQIPDKVFTLQDVIYRKAIMRLYPMANQVKVTFVFVTGEEEEMFLEAEFSHDPNQVMQNTLVRMRAAGENRQFRPTIEEGNDFHSYCRACKTLHGVPGRIPADKENSSQPGQEEEA